jgi:non-heme chloroperoxidase
MQHHTITRGGGTRLHLVEAGNPLGPAILFIHGLSQCWLQGSRQLDSGLAQTHRLVAMDLRGHGQSDRPRNGYGDSRFWADDVDAAIRQLELDRPILCGWSYGPLVILDYVRHHGEDRIGGMHLVSAVTKLGSEAAVSVLTPEFLSLVPQLFSQDAEESVRGLQGLLRLCFAREPVGRGALLYAWLLGHGAPVREASPPFPRSRQRRRVAERESVPRCPSLSRVVPPCLWRAS